ncbi:hypothetical protein Bbelb_271060 [Branchiostoma belcheri]|nr:hypothetical protein Bbelb_271060 [Branchiostoma belcheri]
MYEQAEPVSTPQAGSGREQNNRPRAPYPDPPAGRGNTSGHAGPGKQACHRYQDECDMSTNLYGEAEAVKLENLSVDAPYGTDTSTDTDTAQPDEAKGRRVCYIATARVVGYLVIVGIILLITINETYNQQKDISRISTTVDALNMLHGQNQTGDIERLSEFNMAVQCPSLSPSSNGIVHVTGSNSYGDVVHFTCEPGYKLVGTSSLTRQWQWLERDSSWVVDSAGRPRIDRNGMIYDAAKALDGAIATYWNPQATKRYYNNWYILLNLKASHTLIRIAVNNYGDITHDIAAFILQKSRVGSPYIWEDVVSVDDVIGGTRQRQKFGGFRGTARYWRFVVTWTHSGYQPWLLELNFFGISRGMVYGVPGSQVTTTDGYM